VTFEHLTANTLDPTPSVPYPAAKPKLLIVDDDKGIRIQMKWSSVQAYEVFLAADRKTALEVFSKEHPDLVNLD